MLTRDFSCSQRRARDGCCIATMPPSAGLVWVKGGSRDRRLQLPVIGVERP